MVSGIKLVEFTPLARLQLEDVIDYISCEFGKKTASTFLLLLEKNLQNIAEGKVVNRFFFKSKNIRYFIANRKNYVLYREMKNCIQVVGIYGVKQDTGKIKRNFRK